MIITTVVTDNSNNHNSLNGNVTFNGNIITSGITPTSTEAATYLYDSGDGYIKKKSLVEVQDEICRGLLYAEGPTNGYTDCNNMPCNNGTYFISIDAINSPIIEWGLLKNMFRSDTIRAQFFTSIDSGHSFSRGYRDGVWTPWRTLSS